MQSETPQEAGRESLCDENYDKILVHGLWKKGEGCVLDVYITDTDSPAYWGSTSEKALERHAKKKDFS